MPEEKEFTQSDVDKILAERLDRDKIAQEAAQHAKENEELKKQLAKVELDKKSAEFDAFLSKHEIKLKNEDLEELRKTFDNDTSKLEASMKIVGNIKPDVKEQNPFTKGDSGENPEPKEAKPVTKDDPEVKAMLTR